MNYLFVIHDAQRSGHHNIAELTGWKQVVGPLLDGSQCQIESRRNDTALVQAANKLDNNLAATMIIDDLEFANVSCNKSISIITMRANHVQPRWINVNSAKLHNSCLKICF
jgi:hypothetical protein